METIIKMLFKYNAMNISENETYNGSTAISLTINTIEFTTGDWLLLLLLCAVTAVTVTGNALVIYAIMFTNKLRRNVANCFIASLAAADLLLGALVMSFAVVDQARFLHINRPPRQTRKVSVLWPFGQNWCDIWHALDVLSSTASILNLCAISIERYMAVSDPFKHQRCMTHLRCFFAVCLVWMCSALISFPAIAWWRESAETMTNSSNTMISEKNCQFSNDKLYLLFSSCISFYIPLAIMIYVYYRIFCKARSFVRALSSGARVFHHKSAAGNLVLQMHRGGGLQEFIGATANIASSSDKKYSTETLQSAAVSEQPNLEQVKRQSHTDQTRDAPHTNDTNVPEGRTAKVKFINRELGNLQSLCISRCALPTIPDVLENNMRIIQLTSLKRRARLGSYCSESAVSTRTPSFKFIRRWQRFSKEQRTAKTLGIIIFAFIVCWLPFITYNTVKATEPLLNKYTDAIVFRVVTWLGYINSTINPFIYAYSLRDIRQALSGIICGLVTMRYLLRTAHRQSYSPSQPTDPP